MTESDTAEETLKEIVTDIRQGEMSIVPSDEKG